MEDFDDALEQVIDVDESAGLFTDGRGLIQQLQDMQHNVDELQIKLNHVKEQMISSLGTEIRKRQPGVDIGLDSGRCRAGHRASVMIFEPDLDNGTWSISGSPFARKFARDFPHLTKMGDDVEPLAHAAADFFTSRYKRLGGG